jgi:putative ABC transport system permease protein
MKLRGIADAAVLKNENRICQNSPNVSPARAALYQNRTVSFHRRPTTFHLGTGADAQVWTEAPGPLAVFARHSIPEVAKAVRIIDRGDKFLTTYGSSTSLESNTVYADPDFFTVFDFPLLEGNRAHPFIDDHSIVITQSIAEKYFGNADPIGKALVFDKKGIFTVTGVLTNFPANSSIHYDIIFPMDLLTHLFAASGENKPADEDLDNFVYATYVQLKPGGSPAAVQEKLTAIYRDKVGADARSDFFVLQPLRKLHLISADGNSSALSIRAASANPVKSFRTE